MKTTPDQLSKSVEKDFDYLFKNNYPYADWFLVEAPHIKEWIAKKRTQWVEEARRATLEEVVKAYKNKAKEYRKDGLTVISKFMVDMEEIALELLYALSRTKKEEHYTDNENQIPEERNATHG